MNRLRRAVLALALAAPLLARAQARPRKIGIIVPAPGYPDRYEALIAGLRALGWAEGKNLAIEWRHAEGKYERIGALTQELASSGAEVLITNSTIAVVNVRKATATIPIVAAAYGDPVATGLAASLARPGGNVTGISVVFDGIGPKMVELAFETLPKLSRLAILHNSKGSALTISAAKEFAELAAKAGAKPLSLGASTPAEVDAALAAAVRERCEALLVGVEPFMVSQRQRIADFGLKQRMPLFAQSVEFVESGFLASYGPDFRGSFRRAASFVDRILKGANPAEMPVEQVSTLELGVNRKTAAAIGVTIPRAVLLRADRVIE